MEILVMVFVAFLLWGLLKFVFKVTWGLLKFTGFLLSVLAVPVLFALLLAFGISALLFLPVIMLFTGIPMFRHAPI